MYLILEHEKDLQGCYNELEFVVGSLIQTTESSESEDSLRTGVQLGFGRVSILPAEV